MIGVAREAAIDSQRRKKREEREKQIEKMKEQLQESVKEASELISEASEAGTKADQALVKLNAGKATATAAEMVSLADETDGVVEAAKKSLTAAKDAIAALTSEEPELKSFITGEVKKLQNSLNPVESKNIKASGICKRFREDATKKNTAELEKLRTDALAMIFHHQGAKKLLSLGVLEAFDTKKKGRVDESSFVRFFKTCEMKDEDDERMSEED